MSQMSSRNLAAILMAAGSGSRFGGGKLTHPLPKHNETIAERAWLNLRAAMDCVCVVVRAGDTATLALFRELKAHVVICDDAALGMGHSLACAVRANAYSEGWIIALADMPFIRPETIAAVGKVIAQDRASIAIPTYRGTRGHPVGFGAEHFRELCALTGDAGAKSIVRRHQYSVTEVTTDDAGILQDIDQRDDLNTLSSPPS